ncbi:large ribosomal subunit protein uL10m isoform X2 [Prorops nasuta]
MQQKRFRKLLVNKPNISHYERRLVEEFVTPIYEHPNTNKPWKDLCLKRGKNCKTEIDSPYERLIAKEVRNWFDTSRMIVILHKNDMNMEYEMDIRIALKKYDMIMKHYNKRILHYAFEDSPYTTVTMLTNVNYAFIFSPTPNYINLKKVLKKFPKFVIMAGILEGRLLNLVELEKYGNMDIVSMRVQLVQCLQNAGGNHLNQQLSQHQTTLITRLKQICDQNSKENKTLTDV